MYYLLADLVFVVHLAFIIFVIVGALLVWRWRWVVVPHLVAVVWGLAIEFLNVPCPPWNRYYCTRQERRRTEVALWITISFPLFILMSPQIFFSRQGFFF